MSYIRQKLKQIFFFLFICCISHATFAQSRDAGDSLYRMPAADYFFTLPYEEINYKLIVNVEMNGQLRRMIFDTGAERSMLTKRAADELNCPVLGVDTLIDIRNDRAESVTVRIDSLKMGGVTFGNLPASTIDENEIFTCFEVDGIVGYDVVAQSAVRISPVDQTITVTTQPEKLNLDTANALTLVYIHNSPCVAARIVNPEKNIHADEYFLIDLGANFFASFPTLHYRENYLKHDLCPLLEIVERPMTLGLLGQMENPKVDSTLHLVVPELQLGNVMSFTDIDLYTSSNDDYSFGAVLLDYGVITFDNINHKFYYAPFGKGNVSLAPKKEGKNFDTEVTPGKQMMITKIWNTDLQSQISEGDRVLSIDGVDVGEIDNCMILKSFQTKGKTTIVFEIEDGMTKAIKKLIIHINN
jgi:hypothetical protein